VTRERSDRDGLRLQVYAGRDSLTGRKSWVSRPVPGKVQTALKRAKQVEAELLIRSPLAGIAAAGLRRCQSRSNSGWRGARAFGRSRRPPSPRIGGDIDRSICRASPRSRSRPAGAATLDTLYVRLRK
jgi:hypothetical protein